MIYFCFPEYELGNYHPMGEKNLSFNMDHEADEIVVFQQSDLFTSSFPVMDEIRKQGKLCDVILKVQTLCSVLYLWQQHLFYCILLYLFYVFLSIQDALYDDIVDKIIFSSENRASLIISKFLPLRRIATLFVIIPIA